MATPPDDNAEALFERALKLAEKHMDSALTEAGSLAPYVAVAMIEASVNRGVEVAGHADISDMLRDLAAQIEEDMDSAGGDDEDDDGEEDDDK